VGESFFYFGCFTFSHRCSFVDARDLRGRIAEILWREFHGKNSQEPKDIDETEERRGIGEADTGSSFISFREGAGIAQIDNNSVNIQAWVFNLPSRYFSFLNQVSRILEHHITLVNDMSQ